MKAKLIRQLIVILNRLAVPVLFPVAALLFIALVFYEAAPEPEICSVDVSQKRYLEVREELGEPIYSHGLCYVDGALYPYQERCELKMGHLPILFYDVWVSGWTFGDFVVFPRLQIIEYSKSLEYSRFHASTDMEGSNTSNQIRWMWFDRQKAYDYFYGRWGFKIG
ncbi:hypothetical protein [Aliiroseovarius sp. 2305UL8-7]|uniref:hypothetical protein n=1 Tax=Aliiroseovarius conchicola TaxID=3121637 RepID=UPI00352774BA